MKQEVNLWNRDFVAVCLSSFFLFMTFYILAVTLPIFATDAFVGINKQVGLVMTSFILATVIFRPLAGKWMDEFNKKAIIFFSLALFIVCSIFYVFVHSFISLLALRFIHGIGFGIASTATGAVAVEIVPEQRKGEGIGYFSLFMSLAMVVGPFMGLSLLDHYSIKVVFGACLIFAILSCIFGVAMRIPKQEHALQAASKEVRGLKRFVEPKSIPISLAGSILAFSYGAITTFLSVYAKSIGLESYASYFFIVFAAMIVLSRPFTGRIFDRINAHVLVYPGVILFTLGMIALSLIHGPFLFFAAGALLGLGFGALLPSFQTIAVQAAPIRRRGVATGTYFLLFDAGYGLGSYVLGVIASHTSYATMYFIAGLIVACTSAVYYVLHHRKSSGKIMSKEAVAP